MEELALEWVRFPKRLVESKVAMSAVHHDRMPDVRQVQADLMHPARLDPDLEKGHRGELFFQAVNRYRGN